jgi:L-aminopeptidase/D-esterase-like protein
VLVDGGAVAGVAQRGAAPGTRETDLLDPLNGVELVDAIALSDGSAYGLDVANGVVRWLDEHPRARVSRAVRQSRGAGETRRAEAAAGFRAPVPIVPAAVLIDLQVGGRPDIRPDADCGYRAATAASAARVPEGTVGAGAGATVGKIMGFDRAMKGGIGAAAIEFPNGLQVAALVAVNALGDIVDPRTGAVVAGVRNADGSLSDARALMRSGGALRGGRPGSNTTIGVVATNARLSKTEASRVAQMADDGYSRTIAPAHTQADGDTVFALATGRWNGSAEVTAIGAAAAEAIADAVVRAVTHATSAAGYPAVRDLPRRR